MEKFQDSTLLRKVYLDTNIYNRPFDDQSAVRIKMETIAVFSILEMIKTGKLELVWSFILDYENALNPYDDIRFEVEKLSFLASETVTADETIRTMGKTYELIGIKPRDALHIACAVKSGSGYFITCDDQIIKKMSTQRSPLAVMNPINFILETEEMYHETDD